MLFAGSRIPPAAPRGPPVGNAEVAVAALLCPCCAPLCKRLCCLQGHRKDTGAARLLLRSREMGAVSGQSQRKGQLLGEWVGKQDSKNGRASRVQSLLLPAVTCRTPEHSSCPGLRFPVGRSGTVDSKAEGPDCAQYPPNEGQGDSSDAGRSRVW